MKKAKFAWAILPMAALLGLVGCNNGTTSSKSSSADSSAPSTSQPASSTSDPGSSSSNPGSSSSSSQPDPIVHGDDFVKEIGEGAVTRDYDERYDKMLEDFSGETMLGSGDAVANSPVLRVMVDSSLESFPKTDDAAIYKLALGTPDLSTEAGIGFRIRVREGKLGLKNLVLNLRGDDALATFPVALEDATDIDGEALPELTDEFQDITIGLDALADSYYKNKDGTDSTFKIGSKLVGFHLHSTEDEVAAVIEIAEVYAYSKNNERVTLDNFARTDVNNVGSLGAWWGGSAAGFIVQKGVKVADGKKYITPEIDKTFNNLVLNIQGDATGTVLTALDASGAAVGDPVKFEDAKDVNKAEVVMPVNGTFAPLAINLTESGLLGEGVKTIQISSTTEVVISSVYETNFEEPQLSKAYPHLDTANAKNIDIFERTQNSIDTNWDDSAAKEEITAAGLNGFVSYSHADTIKVDGHDLVLPATAAETPGDYDEVTIGSKNAYKGATYAVFSIKTEDTLANFRFSFGSETAIYLNSAFAAEGLPTIPTAEDYPYGDANGYKWYIVNLELAKTVDSSSALNIYFTGDKEVKIGSIFFAEASKPVYEVSSKAVTEFVDADMADYKWAGAIDNFASQYFGIEMKGDGTSTLDSLRIEYNGATKWLKDGQLFGHMADGTALKSGLVLPETATMVYVDIIASGFATEAGTANLHMGGGFTGKITITKLVAGASAYSAKWSDGASVTTTKDAYSYVLGMDTPFAAKGLFVHVSGDGTENLSLFRVEMKDAAGASTIVWANEADKGLIKRVDGAEFDCNALIDATGVDLAIDLETAGLTPVAGGALHFHVNGANGGALTFGAVTAIADNTPYSVVVSSYSETI